MRLNPDCIRDILLEIESFSKYGEMYVYDPNHLPDGSFLTNYDSDVVMYHIRQCSQCGYLFNTNWTHFEYVGVEDLTPSGHEFLANIREDTTWNKVKDASIKIGATSLSSLAQIASNVISAIIASHFSH